MNKKDNQRARITKLLMKNAYLKLMSKKQTSKITVREICDLSEVNRSTFYLHYNEPNDILKELEDETIKSLTDSLSAIGASKDAHLKAKNYLLSLLSYIKKNDELFHILLIDNTDPHFRQKMKALSVEMVKSSFDLTINEEIKPIIFSYIVSGSIDILTEWISDGFKISEMTLADILYDVCESVVSKFVI